MLLLAAERNNCLPPKTGLPPTHPAALYFPGSLLPARPFGWLPQRIKALWDFAWNCPYMGALRLGKPAIAFKIKVETLKQSCVLENTVTTSLSCFDLIVQALYEAAAKTTGKVVDDFVEPVIECGQE